MRKTALILGISHSTISRYKAGVNVNIKMYKKWKISVYKKWNIDYEFSLS